VNLDLERRIVREWEARFRGKEVMKRGGGGGENEEKRDDKIEGSQTDAERRVENKETKTQKPFKRSSIPSDPSPLKPTPAPPRASASAEAQQQLMKKRVNFNDFENGLPPPDPWDPPVTIKEELEEIGDEPLELAPNSPSKDISMSTVEDKEYQTLDASMESIGIEAAKLASLHFVDAAPETISAFYELYKASMELSCITDKERVEAFKKYPRHPLEYLKHLSRFAELGFTPGEVARALLTTTAIKGDGSINEQIDDETVLTQLMR
jgi:hypothetical protein